MNTVRLSFLLLSFLISCQPPEDKNVSSDESTDGPIALLPENPHYFLYQGRPLVLISSAEHYGAVLNLDFDYKTYLATLKKDGMNYTRIFTGVYYEIYGESFGIEKNTLAPGPGRLVTPWVQHADGKYDLTQWNDLYFQRLKDFMKEAESRDIIVEVTLFSSIYRDEHWAIAPQNPLNTTNIADTLSRLEAQTMNNGELLQYQEMYVRKMTEELNDFDNFFFEIQNEPWSDRPVPVFNIVNKDDLKINDWTNKSDFADSASLEWQEHMAGVIAESENNLAQSHLIAQNYANFRVSIPSISPLISILNFHYAWPEAVRWNYHYNKAIGFDESGFAGDGDQVYRRQAWQFILSGGAIFNNLDYSFYPGSEDGTGKNNAPGGGSPELRKQLKILSDFIHSFPLKKMQPDDQCIRAAPGLIPYALSDGSAHWGIFIRSTGTRSSMLSLAIPEGDYSVTLLNPVTGDYTERTETSSGDTLRIPVDIPDSELALRIIKSK